MNNIDSDDYFIEEAIGEFGSYQLVIFIVVFCTQIPITLHELSAIFLAPTHEYICMDDDDIVIGKCPCSKKVFDNSTFTATIISEWDLVCDRSWMAHLTQTSMLLGILVGCLVYGTLADRFGRKTIYRYGFVVQSSSSLIAALVPEYWTYAIIRFVNGAGTGGLFVTGHVLMMEFIGMGHREVIASLIHLGVTCGHLLLPLIGYCLNKWHYIHLAHGVISIVLIIFYHLLPESVKWMLVASKIEIAVQTLETAAQRNKSPYVNIKEYFAQHHTIGKLNTGSPLDLLRTPNIRKNTNAISFIWLICGFGYYGLSQHMVELSDNIFLHVAISAIATVPGILLSIPMMKLLSRRQSLMLELCISGAVLLTYAAAPDDTPWVMTIITIIGKAVIYMAIITTYLLTIEMYPTVIRATALGNGMVFAGIGSIVAHYVTNIEMSKNWVLLCIFGIVLSGGSLLCIFLPETKGLPLPTTIKDSENL